MRHGETASILALMKAAVSTSTDAPPMKVRMRISPSVWTRRQALAKTAISANQQPCRPTWAPRRSRHRPTWALPPPARGNRRRRRRRAARHLQASRLGEVGPGDVGIGTGGCHDVKAGRKEMGRFDNVRSSRDAAGRPLRLFLRA